jgi:hypothetical protein
MTIIEIGLIFNKTSDITKGIREKKARAADKVLAEVYLGIKKVTKLFEDAEKVVKTELMARVDAKGAPIIDGEFEISITDRAASPATVITQEMVGTTYGGRAGSRTLNVKTIMG